MNSKGASASCRTAHYHHYYHHHHQYHRSAAAATRVAVNAGLYYDYGSGADRALMNRTMDSLNYWKRAFGNPEQMNGLGERIIRLGAPGSRSASATGAAAASGGGGSGASGTANGAVSERLFVGAKERKVSATRSSCKCIRASASAAKLQLLKTLSPIQNSPQFLESPIAAMARQSSAGNGGNENFGSVADCYKYGIDDLTDTDDASSVPQIVAANMTSRKADGFEIKTTNAPPSDDNRADKRRKVSPRRRATAADSSTRSQLENIGVKTRPRTRRNTGNAQRSTVIGIADYCECVDYPVAGAGQRNEFFQPSVMTYNNQQQQHRNSNHNTVSNAIITTSHNKNNNKINKNYVYGDYSNNNSFNLNNNNHEANANNKPVIDQRGRTGPIYRNQPPCGASAAARPPTTGIYDDEDGTLVFAIEI